MGRHSSASGRAIHLNPGCQGDLAGWPIGSHRDLPLPFHADAPYWPGKVSEVLTEHYCRAYPEALGLSSR